jgi:hypothetical protein
MGPGMGKLEIYPSQASFISICERMVWLLIGDQMAGIYGLLGQPLGKCVNKGIQQAYLVNLLGQIE